VSSDPAAAPAGAGTGPGQAPGQPSEEELRAAYEAELSRITSADMMLQAAVSLLNIASHRLAPRAPEPEGAATGAPAPERDLEQVRDAIDGVRALLEILERRVPGELAPLRDALSRLQIAYARETQTGATQAAADPNEPGASAPPGPAPGAPQPGAEEAPGQAEQDSSRPGPAESSGRLWVPGR
jgi:hypothetical protein